jgi:hypothetical protein
MDFATKCFWSAMRPRIALQHGEPSRLVKSRPANVTQISVEQFSIKNMEEE